MSDFIGEAEILDSNDAKYSTANSEFLIKRYAAFANNLVKSLRQPLGTIKKSPLSEIDFQAENGTNWVLCDGQSITGSDLATLTGNTLAPDLITEYSWLTQSDDQLNLWDQSEDDVKAHRHKIFQSANFNDGAYFGSAANNRYLENSMYAGGGVGTTFWGNNGSEPTIGVTNTEGTETKPNTVKSNFFIKVNND